MTEQTTLDGLWVLANQCEKQLRLPVPANAIDTRAGPGGLQLKYINRHYVVERMNTVFGAQGWSLQILDLHQITGTTNVEYICTVRITLTATGAYRTGTGYGSDKTMHEKACKEAESDAFKRAASFFGEAMGNSLYQK